MEGYKQNCPSLFGLTTVGKTAIKIILEQIEGKQTFFRWNPGRRSMLDFLTLDFLNELMFSTFSSPC